MEKRQSVWRYIFWMTVVVILISPIVYWSTGIGQSAESLPAEISRRPDGTSVSSPKAEAHHSLMLPMRLERMAIYPLLLLAFQLSGMAVTFRQGIEHRIHPFFSKRALKPLKWVSQWIPQAWRTRLSGADLLAVFLFFVGLSLAIFLLYLPFNFYRGFIVSHQFGLSTQTVSGWFGDWGKNVLLALIIEGVAWTGFFALMKLFPRRWPLIGGVPLVSFTFVFALLTPILITPLFFEVSILQDADLRDRIIALTGRAGMLVDEVYVIDASSKTTQVNAYFTGFGGAERIVLYDNLITGYTPDQVEVVLAHELGHWYYRHVFLSLLGLSATGWLGLFALRWLLDRVWQPLGLRSPSDVAGLPLILALVVLFGIISLPIENAISRFGEGQADQFALTVSQKPAAFVQLFEQMAEENLSIVDPPPWEKLIFYTHPPISERILYAETFQSQQLSNRK